MPRLLRLTGTTLQGSSAPFIPHSLGVPGYTERYYAKSVPGNAGDAITVVPTMIDGGHDLYKQDGRPSNIKLADDTYRGFRVATTDTGYGTTSHITATPISGPVTIAVVFKQNALNSEMVGAAGYRLARYANGSIGIQGTGTGSSGLITSPYTPGAWGLLIGVGDGANSAQYLNGAKATGSLVAGTSAAQLPMSLRSMDSTIAEADRALFAEIAVWPFAFTDTQAATLRTALKAKFPTLP